MVGRPHRRQFKEHGQTCGQWEGAGFLIQILQDMYFLQTIRGCKLFMGVGNVHENTVYQHISDGHHHRVQGHL